VFPGFQAPDAQARAQLLAELAPLPLQGKAWPTWIKVLAVVVLTLIGLKIGQIAASPLGQNISPAVSASIVLCFAGLIVLARYMIVSQTSITESGIEQTWLASAKSPGTRSSTPSLSRGWPRSAWCASRHGGDLSFSRPAQENCRSPLPASPWPIAAGDDSRRAQRPPYSPQSATPAVAGRPRPYISVSAAHTSGRRWSIVH